MYFNFNTNGFICVRRSRGDVSVTPVLPLKFQMVIYNGINVINVLFCGADTRRSGPT